MTNIKFDPLAVSSKFAICGLPIRCDTYRTCTFMCEYCFANARTRNNAHTNANQGFQLGDVDKVEKRLSRIFDKGNWKEENFLDAMVAKKITWHCGGMSDPFQPAEERFVRHVFRPPRSILGVPQRHVERDEIRLALDRFEIDEAG